jgi:hypothetical protein
MSLKRTLVGVGILGGLGAFVYAFYAYAKKQAALLDNFSWKMQGVSFDSYDLQSVKGKVEILFTSQSDVEVQIQKFIMNFYFNGQQVGYVEDATAFIIPARGTAPISFAFTLNPQLVFGNITDIISYAVQKNDAAISLRGFASIKSGFVSATLPITYDSTLNCILYDKNCPQ